MEFRAQGLRAVAAFTRVVCGARPLKESSLQSGPKIFFANHTSHLDFTLIWSVLPQSERVRTRPVAGRDYWIRNKVTRFVSGKVFNALLIERTHVTRENNPIAQMRDVLEKEELSLIVFPEGTRRLERVPGPFKPGLFHLALSCPDVPLIPVYLENLNRMMPRGTFLPVPLISRINFGHPLTVTARKDNRAEFLEEARQTLIRLADESAHS